MEEKKARVEADKKKKEEEDKHKERVRKETEKEKERDKGLPPPLPSSSVVRTELPPALPSSGASVATYATAATTYTATSTGGYSQRYVKVRGVYASELAYLLQTGEGYS